MTPRGHHPRCGCDECSYQRNNRDRLYWLCAFYALVLLVYGMHSYVVEERRRAAQLESVRVWEEQFSKELAKWE